MKVDKRQLTPNQRVILRAMATAPCAVFLYRHKLSVVTRDNCLYISARSAPEKALAGRGMIERVPGDLRASYRITEAGRYRVQHMTPAVD